MKCDVFQTYNKLGLAYMHVVLPWHWGVHMFPSVWWCRNNMTAYPIVEIIKPKKQDYVS